MKVRTFWATWSFYFLHGSQMGILCGYSFVSSPQVYECLIYKTGSALNGNDPDCQSDLEYDWVTHKKHFTDSKENTWKVKCEQVAVRHGDIRQFLWMRMDSGLHVKFWVESEGVWLLTKRCQSLSRGNTFYDPNSEPRLQTSVLGLCLK